MPEGTFKAWSEGSSNVDRENMTKPREAPYNTISLTVKLDDGKIYRLYYLGEKGKDILKKAVCKPQCWEAREQFERHIKELNSKLNALTDIIGPNEMVAYFRNHILVQIAKRSCRTGDLASNPFSGFKILALQELLTEEKIVHTRNGWWKLAKH